MGFQGSRTQPQNVKAVIEDILGHGNHPPEGRAMLPGQIEADNAARSAEHDGLLFTKAEIEAFAEIAQEAGVDFDPAAFKTVEL